MQSRTVLLILSALTLAVSSACTTSVPAPVVDRNARPITPQPEVRPLPPLAAVPVSPLPAGSTAGSQFYVVQRGETLYGIARSNGVDVNALMQWNNMASGAALREGQVLRMSPPLGAAPAASGAGTTIATLPSSGLIQGQPLPATGAPNASLSPITGPAVTPVEAPLKRDPKAQRLPYTDAALASLQRGDAAAAPGAAEPRTVAPTAGNASPAPAVAAAASPMSSIDVEIKPGSGVERDGIAWTWPTSGKVSSKFNDKAPMKGIDIAANAGTSVVAAASGKVIYVGKEPRGYGQMIVVNHAKETVSVYFHTDKVQVKEQQRVLLGQKLAEVADSSSNKMHFEVRRQGKPLDPIALMPR